MQHDGSAIRQRLLDADISGDDLKQAALTVLLNASSNTSDFVTQLKAHNPGDPSCGDNGDKSSVEENLKCERERTLHNGSSPQMVKSPSDILACIVDILNRTIDHPENVGSISCQCAGRSRSPQDVCQFVAILETLLACGQTSKCPPEDPRPYAPPITPFVHLPMKGTLPTPPQVPQATIDAERQTYYLLYKSFALLSYDAEQSLCNPLYNSSSPLPGWEIHMTANLVTANTTRTPGERVPLARLFSRPNGQHEQLVDFLISVRGTMTSEEWGMDFSYNQIFGDLHQLGAVPIHRGFVALAAALWGPFKPYIQEAFDTGKLGLITITGHSLGGGLAAALSHFLSNEFPAVLPNSVEPRIRVVAFGAGRSGGMKLMSQLSSKVVVRSIESEFDPIPKLPCDRMLGCPAPLAPVPTAQELGPLFSYSQSVGIVPITARDLPPAFSTGPLFNLLLLLPWHICAYDCWTSQNADRSHLSSCLAPGLTNGREPQNAVCYSLPKTKP